MSIDALVEDFLRDGVKMVAVVGTDCEKVETIIDELVVGEARDPSRFMLTSSHPGESLDQVLAFVSSLSAEYSGRVQIVEA